MTFGRFLILTGAIVFFSFGSIRFFFNPQGNELLLTSIIIVFFTAFCLGMYFIFNMSSHSKDANLFTRIFLVSVFVKMVFFIFIILFGIRKMNCSPEKIIIPSIIAYLFFTSFETYYLMVMSKRS